MRAALRLLVDAIHVGANRLAGRSDMRHLAAAQQHRARAERGNTFQLV